MPYLSVGIALIAVIYLVIKYLSRTDIPKIKDLPEIPGVPVFGNLLQFGNSHAKVARALAEKHGPIFQVRFGNRVSGIYRFKTCAPFLSEIGIQRQIIWVDTFIH
jgi:phenylacetate 2-hydroxylase